MAIRTETVSIEGPAGSLEALLDQPASGNAVSVAVVCHPHPLHGGTMTNKVAHMLAKAFNAAGFASVRFNFRGVGDSAGTFADGEGEVADVVAAAAFAKERFPQLPLWLAGFSFGAAMAVRAAADLSPAGLVTVAPAAHRFAAAATGQPGCPWLLVHGDQDEVVPIEESIDWINTLDPGPELVVFPDTGHFFHGKLVELRETVVDFIARQSPRA